MCVPESCLFPLLFASNSFTSLVWAFTHMKLSIDKEETINWIFVRGFAGQLLSQEIIVVIVFRWDCLTAHLPTFFSIWLNGWIIVVQIPSPVIWAFSIYLYTRWDLICFFSLSFQWSIFRVGVLFIPLETFLRNPNEVVHNCSGICWWDANDVLKRKKSYSTWILWFVFLSVASWWQTFGLLVFNFFVLVNIFCFHLLDVCNLLFLAAVIYPSLRQLEGEFIELEDNDLRSQSMEVLTRTRGDGRMKLSDNDLEKEEECGICMENCTRMLLPSCGHTMCNSCFHDW